MRNVLVGLIVLVILGCGCLGGDSSPTIIIESEDEKWVDSTVGALVFMVIDDTSAKIVCDIELNGGIIGTVNMTNGVQAGYPMTLLIGTNYIRVKATDQVGNIAWSSIYTVHVDVEGPVVTIIDFWVSQ